MQNFFAALKDFAPEGRIRKLETKFEWDIK